MMTGNDSIQVDYVYNAPSHVYESMLIAHLKQEKQMERSK